MYLKLQTANSNPCCRSAAVLAKARMLSAMQKYSAARSGTLLPECGGLRTSFSHAFRSHSAKSLVRHQLCRRQRHRRRDYIKMPSAAKDAIAEWIEAEVPDAGKVTNISGRGSSGWASSSRYETDSGMSFFVKQAKGHDDGMFKGEALGLRAMYDTHTLRIPRVYYYGCLSSNPAGGTCIIMEHLDFSSGSDQAALGEQLARMHLADAKDPDAASGKFGFPVDNTIGGTPQANGWMDSWVDFYRERRLRPMLKYANDSEMSRLGDVLMRNLDSLFQGIEVKPSVLHGDLWSGNIGSADGQPTVYDPAVYYGHHEAEFGMSWCAGFGGAFWSAYHELIPRAEGFEERAKLYRFYHFLNHAVLFGGGYRSSAMSELSSLTRNLK